MSDFNIILPSKPRIVLEEGAKGIYEIDGLAPGYGHTLGNSLRRIILSSLPGVSVTMVKIDGVSHEFSTIEGVKEDVIIMILNIKKVRFKMASSEPQHVSLSIKGPKVITASMIKTTGQLEVMNGDSYIAELTGKNAELDIDITVEKGLGFVSKESIQKNKVEIGAIAVDAIFSPIRRVNYEVENMRVGDKTDHNRLRITIETDGTIAPRDAMMSSVEIMINQLEAILNRDTDKKTKEIPKTEGEELSEKESSKNEENKDEMSEVLKTRIDSLTFSSRTLNALSASNIRTIGGLARKKEEDLLEIEGIGEKGIQEIKKVLGDFGIILK